MCWVGTAVILSPRGVLFLTHCHPLPLTQKIHKITFYVIMLCMGPSCQLWRPIIITKTQYLEWVTPKLKITLPLLSMPLPNQLPWHQLLWCLQKSCCHKWLKCTHRQKSRRCRKKLKVAPVDRAKKALHKSGRNVQLFLKRNFKNCQYELLARPPEKTPKNSERGF